MLETYTSLKGDDFHLPDFLDVEKEVTDDPAYSMYNLSKTEKMIAIEKMTSSDTLVKPVVGERKVPSVALCKPLNGLNGLHKNIIMDNAKEATLYKQCVKKNGVKSNGLIKPGRPVVSSVHLD